MNSEREFSNTDAELARCIKSRMREELGQFLITTKEGRDLARSIVREHMLDLTREIIEEDF